MDYDKLTGNTPKKTLPAGMKPWVKGQSGNPSGRPRKSLMQQGLEKLLNDPATVNVLLEAAKKRMLSKGMAGVLETREALDRVDGKVAQEIVAEVTVSLAEAIAQRRQDDGDDGNARER
jgi:uncharacterized protein DUF5681